MSSNDELVEFKAQLAKTEEVLAVDPDNVEQKQLRESLLEIITLLEEDATETKPPANTTAPAPPPPPARPPPAAQKLSKKDEGPITAYNANEKVLARWTDGKFYNAVIKSSFGPDHAKQYMIKYTDYNEQRQVQAKDLKPLQPKTTRPETEKLPTNKRKIDSLGFDAPDPVSSAPSPAQGTVTAGPKIDASLAQQIQDETARATDGPARPPKVAKKLASKGSLNRSKASWLQFQKSGIVKQKDSMFRTSDEVKSKVGITGSGQPMRSDPKRSRHVHQRD